MPFYGGYWLYNREMPCHGWPGRLREWLERHGNIPEVIWVRVGDDRDAVTQAMYIDCVEHGFSARAFVDMAEGGLGDTMRLSSLDKALDAVTDAPRWRLTFGATEFAWKIYNHMKPLQADREEIIPCNLYMDGGLRPISRLKMDDVVLHDLCRFRIGLSGEGYTLDEPALLAKLKSTPGFAEWKSDAEELFGPLHEYFYGL